MAQASGGIRHLPFSASGGNSDELERRYLPRDREASLKF
jgi:hypothetical protein